MKKGEILEAVEKLNMKELFEIKAKMDEIIECELKGRGLL